MSDEDNLDEVEGGESTENKGTDKKKSGGLLALLLGLLKFAALGLGALALIITVAVVTFNVMNQGGKAQTDTGESTSPYVGKRPEYAFFSQINTVRTRTRDPVPYSVVVDMVIGYDMNDKNASVEMTSRVYELRDFVRNFFAKKYADDLKPEKEAQLKQELINALNTQVLDSTRARIVLFNTFEIQEM
ncbi:MAG: flagellar basal body-associated FliL family protein [Treponema sp.]|jgi:flagellar FliL protein|nr:flagellar basal body-associated FliL family protein [Treponema sp.]